MKYLVGTSNYEFRSIGDKPSLSLVKELGADTVDFFTNHESVDNKASVYSRSDSEIAAYYRDMRAYADSLGLGISQTHGRLRTYMNKPSLDELCLENARRDLLAAASMGVPFCVMHGVTTSEMGADAAPDLMRELNYRVFSKILPWAKEYGVKIASETFGFCSKLSVPEFFANAAEFKRTYDRIAADGDNSDFFKICIDTGHVHSSARYDGVKVADFIRMMGDAVVCLHLHDNDGTEDQHRLIGTGSIDWNDTLTALDEIGYNGVYNLEVGYRKFCQGFEADCAAFAIKHLRKLLENHSAEI